MGKRIRLGHVSDKMQNNPTEMRRIVVVGTCGLGKTTLAREIVRRIGRVHVELDAFECCDSKFTHRDTSLA